MDGSTPPVAATDDADLSKDPAMEGLKKRQRTVSWADKNGHDLEMARE